MGIIKGSVDPGYSEIFDQAAQFLGGSSTPMTAGDSYTVNIGGNRGATAITPWRLTDAEYLEIPREMLRPELVSNNPGTQFEIVSQLTDQENAAIQRMVLQNMRDNPGRSHAEAVLDVADSIPLCGTIDPATGNVQMRPFLERINDASIVEAQVPFFRVAYSRQIIRQPFVKGKASTLVMKTRVPNPWADVLSFFTERFEGSARISNVGQSQMVHNINLPVKTGTGQLLSNMVNLMVDWEAVYADQRYGGLHGNFLTSRSLSTQESYADFVLDLLHNILIYFGNPSSNFEGLLQQTVEETWSADSLDDIKNDGSNASQGVAMIKVLYKIFSDLLVSTSFIGYDIAVNCSPQMYSALEFTIGNDQFHLKSPLSIIKKNFTDSDIKAMGVSGTQVSTVNDLLDRVSFNVDPMLGPNTPMNPYATDLTFIVLRKLKSDNGPSQDTVYAPTAIEKAVVPTVMAGNRYGNGKTTFKRIGSIIAPFTGTVKIIRGLGI